MCLEAEVTGWIGANRLTDRVQLLLFGLHGHFAAEENIDKRGLSLGGIDPKLVTAFIHVL
jgi:hypothetical protein